MSADFVVAYFGVKYILTSEDEIDEVESRSDSRIVAARKYGLDSYYGPVADGGDYVLLIGHMLAKISSQDDYSKSIGIKEMRQSEDDVIGKLRDAELTASPEYHFHLDAEY